jgi:hypothetical protein
MSEIKIQKYLKNKSKKQFTNKTYLDFRNDLLGYAREFYGDNILDFSETSLGGLFLDFAAIVGDSLVFYAEQQFNELDYETATNIQNINKHLKRANIKNNSSYPSSVEVTFSIEVEKDINSSEKDPKPYITHLPVIKKNTVMLSNNGIQFTLDEDVDFSSDYTQTIGELNEDETPFSLILTKKGLCTSGFTTTETVNFSSDLNEDYFLSYKLENSNVTKIISVSDNDLNEYHEVEYLNQGTVFSKIENDKSNYISIKPVPYRYVIERDYNSGEIFLRFGNGSGKSVKDNEFANVSDLIIPIKNKDTFGRVDLDPNMLLKTNSLGVSPIGKNLSITYKYGGGIIHNVAANSITEFLDTPIVIFPIADDNVTESIKNIIIESIEIDNEEPALGGAPAPTLDDLKASIPLAMNSQNRIITYDDLISRILTMPSDFGKIEKVVALDNPNSSFSKDLFVTCKDSEGFYVNASDAIKLNLAKYINEFRLISDNYNILDVPVYNFGIKATVKVAVGFDIETVIFDISTRIFENLRFDLLQIGQPINVNEIVRVINNTDGVVTLITDKRDIIVNKTEKDAFFDFDFNIERSYFNNVVDSSVNYIDGFIYPPRGGIFEMKYSSQDILIIAN